VLIDRAAETWERLPEPPDRAGSPRFTPDGRHLAAGATGGRVYLWSLAGRSWALAASGGPEEDALQLAFSPGGQRLAAWAARSLAVWDMPAGKPLCVIYPLGEAFRSAAFSADATRLVTTCWFDRTLRLHDARTGALLVEISREVDALWAVFRPGSDELVTSWGDGAVRLYDSDGRLLREIAAPGLDGELACSPDGSRVALVDGRGLQIWSLDSGLLEEHLPMPRAEDHIQEVSFSADGGSLGAMSCDGHLYVWPVSELDAPVRPPPTAPLPKPPAPSDRQRVEAAFAWIARPTSWTVQPASPEDFAAFVQGAGDEALVIYRQDDWESAFDASGALIAPLRMRWRASFWDGDRCRIQVGFAEQGLSPHFAPGGPDFSLEPEHCGQRTALIALVEALASLRRLGFAAEASWTETTSAGWENATERCAGRPLRTVFWNHQSHRASFDEQGHMVRALSIHWEGDRELITEVLQQTGLGVRVPASQTTCFEVEPGVPRRG
jgi:hypothetical protein